MTAPEPPRPTDPPFVLPPATFPPNATPLTSSAEVWNAWAYADMLERRVVHLTGMLDDAAAANLCAQLMTLDADGDDRVHLQVNAAGGTLSAAVAVMDTVELLGVPVHAVCLGRADGPPALVLAVCDHRVVAPRATIRLTEPGAAFDGSADQLAHWAGALQDQRRAVAERLAERSRLSADEVADAMSSGRVFRPDEALAAGLVDEVAAPSADVLRFPRRVGYGRR